MKGQTKHPLYKTWSNMIARCEIPGASRYKDYGGRGISVCQEWRHSFDTFVNDMGPRPNGYSIDRIDTNGNYTKDNCRWASSSEQARNKRAARLIEIDGISYHVAELEEKYGVNMRTIYARYEIGLPFNQIVSREKLYNNSESQKKATTRHAELKRSMTHCKHGHEFTEKNTYIHQEKRMCRKCRRAWDRFLYYKRTRPLTDFL